MDWQTKNILPVIEGRYPRVDYLCSDTGQTLEDRASIIDGKLILRANFAELRFTGPNSLCQVSIDYRGVTCKNIAICKNRGHF